MTTAVSIAAGVIRDRDRGRAVSGCGFGAQEDGQDHGGVIAAGFGELRTG